MKKVIASAAGILYAVFGIAILGLLLSLTFGALGKLFPGNFANQLWGLVLFDLAAMIWAVVFVFKSESTGEYATAAIGFIAAFVGTLGMVAVEVMLSGQTYVEVEDWVGQWLVYGFVIMTALHSALLYAHHAAAPDISEKINVGVARGEIVSEAIKQATQSLDVQKAILAQSITQEIIEQVKRDLRLPTGQILDLPALPAAENSANPIITPREKPASFSISNLFPFWWSKKNDHRTYEAVAPAPKASVSANPLPRSQYAPPQNSSGEPQYHPITGAQQVSEPAVEEGTQAEASAPFRGDGISA